MLAPAYRNFKSNGFLTVFLTAVCFLFTYFYYDFFYVEYEGLFDSFYSGNLTNGLPFRSIYFLGNIGTSYLYSLLYQLIPGIEWISWIFYIYLFGTCFLGLFLLRELLPEKWPLWLKVVTQVTVYFLIFADHNIHFIFTRVSYMITGISLAALVCFFREPGMLKTRRGLFVLLNLLFVLGTLTRSESATAAFLQTAFFGIFYLKNVKQFVILFLFPTLFLGTVLGTITYDLKTSTEFYKQIEPDIEAQLCERENAVPLSHMKTYRDSVMWLTAKDIMWSDPKVISPAYLRSLIRPEKFIYTDSYHWERVYRNVSAIALRFWYLGLMGLLFAIAILIQGGAVTIINFFLWFAFAISFWLLTAVQTYTVKVNDRSFSPLISIFLFCFILLLLQQLKGRISMWLYPVLTAIFILFGVHLYHLKTESNQLKQDLDEYQQNLKMITHRAAGKYLVVNSSSCDYLFCSNKPFHPFDFSDFKRIYISDGYNMPFLPYYRRYLEKECRCDMYEFPGFWDYLRTIHEEVVVVSTTRRMNVLKDYLKEIHHYNLPVAEDSASTLLQLQKNDLRGVFADLRVYTLGR